MKITNKLNLPWHLVDAVENDPYNAGASDISVTRLIAPPRMVALNATHKDELEEDAADRSFSLMGQAIHTVLERVTDREGDRVIERRMFQEVGGWTISGQLDLWENDIVYDHKFTSVWETLNGLKPEKIQQLNILAWLCRKDGLKVDGVKICAIYRDWSKTKAKGERDYPQHSIGIIDAPLWTDAECQSFIEERVYLHQQARIELPLCSPDDQWEKPSKYALMKEGRISAIKLENSEEDLMGYAEAKGHTTEGKLKKGCYIEFRPGEKMRCENYCTAAPFCSQFNDA